MRDEKSGKESKQVNFRIDPDSAEAFRLFCTTHGLNQAQGFDHLIQVLELNNAKAATPGRAVEIENFERLLKEILSAYIGSESSILVIFFSGYCLDFFSQLINGFGIK